MSEYTREEILKLIEENGGPDGLDLSGKDLSGIDLSIFESVVGIALTGLLGFVLGNRIRRS